MSEPQRLACGHPAEEDDGYGCQICWIRISAEISGRATRAYLALKRKR